MSQYDAWTKIKAENIDDTLRQEIHNVIRDSAEDTLEAAGENPAEFNVEIKEELVDGYTKFSWTMTKK